MKVLIFTEMKIGEGHYQAAKAVANELEQISDSSSVKIISGISRVHPLLEWFGIRVYFHMLKHFPSLWRMIYQGMKESSKLQTLVFAWRLGKTLQEEKPDIILCTHPACISALHYLKQRKEYCFTLAAICTDFDFHPLYVSTLVDYYFVAHHQLKQKLSNQFGVQEEKIFDYGIPIRSSFEKLVSRGMDQAALAAYEEAVFTPKKRKINLLVLGGAEGLGPMKKILEVFKPYQAYFQLQIITGKNKQLYNQLRNNELHYAQIFGYVDNMDELFKLADLILTKPGGLTISEALACGKPCLLFHPIPGHEEANKDFLVQHGLAIYIEKIEEIPQNILTLLHDEEECLAWQKRIDCFYQKGAAKRIAEKLIIG